MGYAPGLAAGSALAVKGGTDAAGQTVVPAPRHGVMVPVVQSIRRDAEGRPLKCGVLLFLIVIAQKRKQLFQVFRVHTLALPAENSANAHVAFQPSFTS